MNYSEIWMIWNIDIIIDQILPSFELYSKTTLCTCRKSWSIACSVITVAVIIKCYHRLSTLFSFVRFIYIGPEGISVKSRRWQAQSTEGKASQHDQHKWIGYIQINLVESTSAHSLLPENVQRLHVHKVSYCGALNRFALHCNATH